MIERKSIMNVGKRRYSKKRKCFVCLGKSRNHVSIRLPDEIYDVIDSYDGKNFSDKLVNYIFDKENEILDQ